MFESEVIFSSWIGEQMCTIDSFTTCHVTSLSALTLSFKQKVQKKRSRLSVLYQDFHVLTSHGAKCNSILHNHFCSRLRFFFVWVQFLFHVILILSLLKNHSNDDKEKTHRDETFRENRSCHFSEFERHLWPRYGAGYFFLNSSRCDGPRPSQLQRWRGHIACPPGARWHFPQPQRLPCQGRRWRRQTRPGEWLPEGA